MSNLAEVIKNTVSGTRGEGPAPDNTENKMNKIINYFARVLGVVVLLVMLGISIYVSSEPEQFVIPNESNVTGYATLATLIKVADIMLHKPGGFMSNDIAPPYIFLDNIAAWEFGVLVQVRDLSRRLRQDMARSLSQSKEDADLAVAEPFFSLGDDQWLFPASEDEYRKGIKALERFQQRLIDPEQPTAQFYARADNLQNWLQDVGSRLGSLSQRLSASVGARRINTDLAGDPAAKESTPTFREVAVKTPWYKIDDEFYEARGTAWALLHFLKAIEVDFHDVLLKKNALTSLQQIIMELESSQVSMGSPLILNGSGYGIFANHSLVMANYISRANAAIIDLRALLQQG